MSYKFYFNNIKDANYFYDRVIEIAENFGGVRLSDLYDLLGESSDYLSSQVIWNKETILFDVGRDFNPRYGHYVHFPEPDQYKYKRNSYKDYYCGLAPRSTVEPKITPEPFNITILMDPSKDPYTTIREVIQQANEIKDRPVFITINRKEKLMKNDSTNTTMTPEEFKQKMTDAYHDHYDVNDDVEVVHYVMDGIICDLLRDLGYGEGIDIFNNTPKWYS